MGTVPSLPTGSKGEMGSVRAQQPAHFPLRGRKDLRGLAFAKPPWQIQERALLVSR